MCHPGGFRGDGRLLSSQSERQCQQKDKGQGAHDTPKIIKKEPQGSFFKLHSLFHLFAFLSLLQVMLQRVKGAVCKTTDICVCPFFRFILK